MAGSSVLPRCVAGARPASYVRLVLSPTVIAVFQQAAMRHGIEIANTGCARRRTGYSRGRLRRGAWAVEAASLRAEHISCAPREVHITPVLFPHRPNLSLYDVHPHHRALPHGQAMQALDAAPFAVSAGLQRRRLPGGNALSSAQHHPEPPGRFERPTLRRVLGNHHAADWHSICKYVV